MNKKLKPVFQSPFDSCGINLMCTEVNGKPFTVLRAITKANATYAQEVLPMYIISIDGREVEAWPEEIYEDG